MLFTYKLLKSDKFPTFYLRKPVNIKAFFLMLGMLISLVLYLVFGGPPIVIDFAFGVFSALLALMMSFFFGYIGFLFAFLYNCVAIGVNYTRWIQAGDFYYLTIVAVMCMHFFASLVISIGVERIRNQREKLEWLSVTDGLTEIYNHRYFWRRLDEELACALRNDYQLGLCMLDIDQFKLINDTKGHTQGDKTLVAVARLLEDLTRKGDLVFRYGGDEFAVILPHTDAAGVRRVMERIKAGFREAKLTYSDIDPSSPMTLSVGYSVFPCPAGSKEEIVYQADRALYYAKSMGRDRIDFFSDVFDHVGQICSAEGELAAALKSLLLNVCSRDHYTLGHSERVAGYALIIGKAIGLSDKDLKHLRIAALLHDIGRMEIPDNILNKKGKLTEEEYNVIKKHPDQGVEIIKSLPNLGSIIEDVRHHHERYDGKGYPAGISKQEMPLGARIIAVADAFDAMQSERPYRRAMHVVEAAKELKEGSGSQFDPELVGAFLGYLSPKTVV